MKESKDIRMTAISSQPTGSSESTGALAESDFAADVRTADVTHSQVVELITAGRSGSLGLAPAEAAESM